MKTVVLLIVASVTLAACGVDGEPLTPSYSAKTTVGFNSSSGAFNSTVLGVRFGQ